MAKYANPRLERVLLDIYNDGLFWILREHGGPNGGWPPRDIVKVSGWTVVRLLAHMSSKSVREVAADIVERSQALVQQPDGLQ